jgi:hypothetical protein
MDRRELPSVLLGCGPTVVDGSARQFPQRAQQVASNGAPDSEYICVVKFRRPPTIREQADLMAAGLRIYRSIPHYALIIRIPARQVSEVASLPSVEWVAELDPSQKYPPSQVFHEDVALAVYTLVGDTPEARRDIVRLGGEIRPGLGMSGDRGHQWFFYGVRIDVARVPDIARLWWVQKIEQAPPLEGMESDLKAGSSPAFVDI